MTGTGVAQVLGVLTAPLLTRLYSPEAFGEFGIFLALTMIATVVACGRYEMAVMLPKRDVEAASLTVLAGAIAVGTSVSVLMLMLAWGEGAMAHFGVGGGAVWVWLVPTSVLLIGIFHALNAWTTRQKAFRHVAQARMGQAVSSLGAQLGGGVIALGSMGLLGGYLVGYLAGAITLARRLWRTDRGLLLAAVSWTGLRRQAIAHRDFPLYALPIGLLNAASYLLPNLLFPLLFGVAVLGQYVLSYRVFSLPLSVVGQAFMQVFYQRAAEEHANGHSLHGLVLRSYRQLLLLAVVPALLLLLAAPTLFALVFGREWMEAGVYSRLLVPFLALKFAVSPSTSIFAIFGHQRYMFYLENVLLVLRTSAILVGGLVFQSAIHAVGLYAAAGVLINLFYMWKVMDMIRKEDAARTTREPVR